MTAAAANGPLISSAAGLKLKREGVSHRQEQRIVPVVKGEFEKLVEKYIDNLIKKFGGEV